MPTTFAVARFRSRKRRSGTSGERRPRLDPEEHRQEHSGEGEQAQRSRGTPADLVPVHDRVDGDHGGGGHRHRTRDVEPPGRHPDARRQQHERQREDGDADRDVDEEDPVPVERVGQDAAEQDADRAAARRDEAEDAHRLRPLGRLGEQRDDERERDGRDDRATDSLHRAGRDQQPLRVGEAAADGREGEQRDPGEEHPPVPDDVAEAAAQEQESAERQQVGVHDPCERLLREAEVLPDRRERHPHDGHVEHDHQVAQAEDDQREPAGAVVGDGHRMGSFQAVAKRCRRVGRPVTRELIAAAPMTFGGRHGRTSDGPGCATHARARRSGADRPPRPPRARPPGLRAPRGEHGRHRGLRRARRRAGRRHGRRARPSAARRAPSPLPRDPAERLGGAPRPRRLHGARGRGGSYASRRAGRPNSGNTRSVSRKNVSSTIAPASTSTTWSAHGSKPVPVSLGLY